MLGDCAGGASSNPKSEIKNPKSEIVRVGRVVLESTSPGLQPGAGTAAMSGGPSQLPTALTLHEKSPMSL
jgi:hypothetical protein